MLLWSFGSDCCTSATSGFFQCQNEQILSWILFIASDLLQPNPATLRVKAGIAIPQKYPQNPFHFSSLAHTQIARITGHLMKQRWWRNQEYNRCLLAHIFDSVWYSNRFLNIKNRMDVSSFAHNMLVQSSVSVAWWDSLPPFTENVNASLQNNLAAWTVTMTFKTFFSPASFLVSCITCTTPTFSWIIQGICYSPLEHFSFSNPFIPSPHPECEITTSQRNLFLWPGTWSTLHWDILTCTTRHTQPHNLHSSFSIYFETFNPSCLPLFVFTLCFLIPHLSLNSIKTEWTREGEMKGWDGTRKENNSMWGNLASQIELSSQYTGVGAFQKHYLPSKS